MISIADEILAVCLFEERRLEAAQMAAKRHARIATAQAAGGHIRHQRLAAAPGVRWFGWLPRLGKHNLGSLHTRIDRPYRGPGSSQH